LTRAITREMPALEDDPAVDRVRSVVLEVNRIKLNPR
jgi:hypothetical protein